MTATARGIPLGSEIQVGFYGVDREVFQQLHEKEEGYSLSRRWLSSLPHEIPSFRNGILECCYKKKYTLSFLGFETQTVEANSSCLLQIVDGE